MLCMHLVSLYFHQSEMIAMHEIIALLCCQFLNIVVRIGSVGLANLCV